MLFTFMPFLTPFKNEVCMCTCVCVQVCDFSFRAKETEKPIRLAETAKLSRTAASLVLEKICAYVPQFC